MIRGTQKTNRKGFTLIEMTVIVVVGSMIAAMSLTMFNQQLMSFKILKTQNFLISEAPQINNTLNRIVSRANFFQMYTTLSDAQAEQNAVIANGKVLALRFEPIGNQTNPSFGVIYFDTTTSRLEYYHLTSMAQLATKSPDWSISSQLSNAVFYIQNGVLRIKLTGPDSEVIVYSTTTQR